MITKIIPIIFFCTFSFFIKAQKEDFKLDFKNPKTVLNAIFYAAQSKDYAILQCLCDPFQKNDSDTKAICKIPQTIELAKKNGAYLKAAKITDAFSAHFNVGKITGEVVYTTKNGIEYAEIPFWFNHELGEKRSNETMILVSRYGNWYLADF